MIETKQFGKNNGMATSGALSGLRVIDLTRILAGPFCTMNLGDMGAEIIKIENPKGGDDTRGWGPPFAGDESAYYLGVNRNKKSVAINLKEERGLEILGDLVSKSDVLIENFKSGTMEKWGFTPEWFEANAPKVVHCSITGYGDDGPKGGMPGYDFLLQAESGLMSITGEEEGAPQKLGVAIVDVCTGQYAAISILAALRSVTDTGRGQRVDVSLFNTSLTMLINVASSYLISGTSAKRFGNGHPTIVPYRDFPCSDGDIAIAVGNDGQFERLSKALGNPGWAQDPRFIRNQDRVNNREICEKLIRDVVVNKTVSHWINEFEAEGIPCSKINAVEEALESEQARANNMVLNLDHPTAGSIKMMGIPYNFSETPAGIREHPPLLGEHTHEVLDGVLGIGSEDIQTLEDNGVINKKSF